ncbi:MAG: serine/threonine-protein kinase [Spirulinaceae cyanobacterium]
MSYCLNPQCLSPENPNQENFCCSCGGSLLLRKRYRAIQALGQGGFGRTFLAVDQDLPDQPLCVIKQLYLLSHDSGVQQKAIQLFKQEAVQLNQLGQHEQIPSLLAHFEEQQHLYLVQELIEGKTLAQETWQGVKDVEGKVWQFFDDLLPILQYLHTRKVIHRDIKPDNIIRRHNTAQLVLIDFGIARLFTDTALMGGATIVGTAEYMPPEQTKGKVLPASDLYSLGVTCLNLLTKVSPFAMFDVVEDKWLWQQHLSPQVRLSPHLIKIINKLVEPSLRNRYRCVEEVLEDLPNATQPSLTINTNHPPVNSLSAGLVSVGRKGNQGKPEAAVAINYSHLRNFLAKKKWLEADEETWAILCDLASKPTGSYLSQSEIKKFPCQHLQKLDTLWYRYSKGQFGFGVQKRIYEEVGGEYDLFCNRVGWQIHRSKSPTANFQFNLRSPVGHLPTRRWVGGYSWWKHAKVLASKLEECRI